MKKIFVFLLLMVVSFALKAQYPIQQNLGSDSTIIYIKGAARTVGGFINGTYTDTAAANLTRIRQYQAAQIFTTGDSAIWFRMPGATKWVRIMPATPPSPNVDTSYWSLSGNYVADRVATPRLGTTTGHELNIITNDSIRLTIPVYGIRRVTGNENRYLVIDTTIGSNMYVGYMDGGSGSTYTAGNGLTLSGSQFKLGGNLAEETTVNGNSLYAMLFEDVNGLYVSSRNNYPIQLTGWNGYKRSIMSIVGDSIKMKLNSSGNWYVDSLITVGTTTGKKVVIHDTVTGKVERINPASLATTSLPISSLTAATGTNTIDNGDYAQSWQWNNLSIRGLYLSSVSTNASASPNEQKLLNVYLAGANANADRKTYSGYFDNRHTGTNSSNIAGYFSATNGTNNYAIIVPSGGGRVGFGTSTPNASALLDIESTTQGAVLPRMNTTQMNAISSPVAGLMVYNSDSTSYCYYNGSAWLKMGSGTPTLQQVLTAGSTLATNANINANGNEWQIANASVITLGSQNETNITAGLGTILIKDSITLLPNQGVLNINSLRTWSGISDTTHKKPMTWDTRNGRWEYAANWYGGGGGGTVSSASGTGVSLVNGSSLIKRLKEGTGITITDNTDSVTINRVTDSTLVRNQRWKYRNTFELMDEFLGHGVAPGWNSQSSGAGSSAGTSDFAFADLDTTWQGATYASTGTTTTGRGLGMYGNATSSNTGSFRGYNTSFAVYETRVRFDTLSNTTNEYSALFGWMDWFGSSFYQRGMKFVYDRATYGDYWVLRSDDGGTSAVVTTTAVAAKTDYVLRIEVYNWQMGSSGGSIKAYINDVEVVASSGTYPIVSNIAKTDTFYPCYWIQKSAGTVARKVFLDWVYQYAEFITR